MGTGMLSVPTPFVLFHNALALSHGVTFNPDDIGIIYDPVTDGVSQSRVIQVLMPARNIELRAENGRGCFGWPGVKFCVSVFRQKSRMALESRADSGLNPLFTESHGGQNGMRAGTA